MTNLSKIVHEIECRFLKARTICINVHVHFNMLKETSIWIENMSCYFFPILSKMPLFFPMPRAPGPSPKKGCESPALSHLIKQS